MILTNNKNGITLYKKPIEEKEQVYLYSGILSNEQLKNMKPKVIISYNYKFIINKSSLDVIKKNGGSIINMHISYLMWNRGSSPNFWSIIDNTPKGITIHEIEEGLDTGNILLQKQLYFDEEIETFTTTYNKLQEEIIDLLIVNWQAVKHGK